MLLGVIVGQKISIDTTTNFWRRWRRRDAKTKSEEETGEKMKIIYWRWKGKKTINKSYIQEDLGNILELSDAEWGTKYPLRILKKEIDIIKPCKKKSRREER